MLSPKILFAGSLLCYISSVSEKITSINTVQLYYDSFQTDSFVLKLASMRKVKVILLLFACILFDLWKKKIHYSDFQIVAEPPNGHEDYLICCIDASTDHEIKPVVFDDEPECEEYTNLDQYCRTKDRSPEDKPKASAITSLTLLHDALGRMRKPLLGESFCAGVEFGMECLQELYTNLMEDGTLRMYTRLFQFFNDVHEATKKAHRHQPVKGNGMQLMLAVAFRFALTQTYEEFAGNYPVAGKCFRYQGYNVHFVELDWRLWQDVVNWHERHVLSDHGVHGGWMSHYT